MGVGDVVWVGYAVCVGRAVWVEHAVWVVLELVSDVAGSVEEMSHWGQSVLELLGEVLLQLVYALGVG